MATEQSRVAVISGDGIGPEVVAEAVRAVTTATAGRVLFEALPYGADHTIATGETIPPGEIDRIGAEYDAVLLGALGDARIPDMRHGRDILLGMRMGLDLYVNLRPVRLLDARLCPLKGRGPEDVQITVFRENTEGVYTGIGGHLRKGTTDEVATTQMIATYRATERIIRAAFEYARAYDLPSVCMADKHNAIPAAHGLWDRVFTEVSADYPGIRSFHLYADVAAMELVRNPGRFDVIVTSNLLGDVLSDLGAQIAGGLGLAASGNIHPDKFGLFEPVHGSAPDIAGRGIANPLAAILSGAMLCDHLGLVEASRRIEAAVAEAVAAAQTTTDLGGQLTTREVGDAVCRRLETGP